METGTERRRDIFSIVSRICKHQKTHARGNVVVVE
jgi:hypothetical protein